MAKVTAELKMENGQFPAFAFPGGYPIIYITKNCHVLCAKCATEEFDKANDPEDFSTDPVTDYDTHMEGPSEYCDCGEEIESAYGDPDQPPNCEEE